MKISTLLLFMVALVLGALPSCAGDDDDAPGENGADVEPADDDADDDIHPSDDDSTEAPAFTVVDIPSGMVPAAQLAVMACQGLYNREQGGSVYTHTTDKDSRWLTDLGLTPAATVDAADFLNTCTDHFPSCVRYSYADQQKLLPNILTVGAALGAVPIDIDLSRECDAVFDAIDRFKDRDTAYRATRYVYDHFVDDTTGLAMLNPGYDTGDPRVWDPAFNRDMSPVLVDFVFSQKLFAIYLVNGCIEGSEENALLSDIATRNPWPDPIGVYGYADYWLVFGGYLFESQTRCLDSRNMGAIPTKTTNLSFFSTRRAPIEEPGEIEQNPLEAITYDPAETYVAFTIGDGDNVSYILDARGAWLRQRLADCEQPENSCAPITWTISPHLPRLAPDVLEWYYDMSRETGMDYFMLPPSGHLYAYPSSMGAATQDDFVAATERDARLLDTNATIDWEWWHTWEEAETQFFPKYAGGDIGGVFPVNVPYMFPTFTGWQPDEFFRVIPGGDGGEVVLFRPREWRGVDDSGSGLTAPFYLSPENMAAEIESYPPGTVAYVYMTSDGGLNLENSFMALVQLLPDRVRLVSAQTAIRLALESVQ